MDGSGWYRRAESDGDARFVRQSTRGRAVGYSILGFPDIAYLGLNSWENVTLQYELAVQLQAFNHLKLHCSHNTSTGIFSNNFRGRVPDVLLGWPIISFQTGILLEHVVPSAATGRVSRRSFMRVIPPCSGHPVLAHLPGAVLWAGHEAETDTSQCQR